jgi:ABC-2 type transport system ATP-binding protein
MTSAIRTDSLRKVFGSFVAVRGLTLEVPQGEVFGFLGPNGAGKTTSLKMLLGLTRPTEGSASILGTDLRDRSIRAHVGFLPEHFRFHEWLTAREFLKLHADLYRMRSSDSAERISQLLALVRLEEFAAKQLRTFSKGMLQRIGLAQALLNRPRLIFLDEPTSGLDPAGRILVRDIIQSVNAEGATVFLNSHLLSEVEITCHRVAFIKHGEVVCTEKLKGLDRGAVRLKIRLRILNSEILNSLERFGKLISSDDREAILQIDSEDRVAEIARMLVQKEAHILELTPVPVSLEELFLNVIGNDILQ